MIQLWRSLERKLEERYNIRHPEWVQVNISRHGKIHVTLVASQKDITEEDIRYFIYGQIADYPEDDYKVGFIRIYPCAEAGRLEIKKQKRNETGIYTWNDGLRAALEAELDLDMILIDTRAGFNQWGSLSLLSLSDQVIFVAYPNRENVEGLNIAFEIMQNINMKRYAVAMSKVVASEDGVKKARELFEELDIGQESMIPLYYRQEAALSGHYPMEGMDASLAYQELSNYILDNETLLRNQEFLANGMKNYFDKNYW